MDSLLYEIYNGDYEIGVCRSTEEEKMSKEITPMLDKIKAEFGGEFVDSLTGLYIDWQRQSDFRCYREGFQLGVRLMLEAITAATG